MFQCRNGTFILNCYVYSLLISVFWQGIFTVDTNWQWCLGGWRTWGEIRLSFYSPGFHSEPPAPGLIQANHERQSSPASSSTLCCALQSMHQLPWSIPYRISPNIHLSHWGFNWPLSLCKACPLKAQALWLWASLQWCSSCVVAVGSSQGTPTLQGWRESLNTRYRTPPWSIKALL